MNSIRLRSGDLSYLVDTKNNRVFVDTNNDGQICKTEAITGGTADKALAAAKSYAGTQKYAVPGTKIGGNTFEVRGALTQREMDAFDENGRVANERDHLLAHLDFFDDNGDGVLTTKEAGDHFEALGLDRAKGEIAVLMFSSDVPAYAKGLMGDTARALYRGISATLRQKWGQKGELDIDKTIRFRDSTGIFDKKTGRIVEAQLQKYLSVFTPKTKTQVFEMLVAERIVDPKNGRADKSAVAKFLAKYEGDKDKDELLLMATEKGIYLPKEKAIDPEALTEYLAQFGEALPQADLTAELSKSGVGKVSRSQFESLFSIATVLNMGKTIVTKSQLEEFYRGSLLYTARSLVASRGGGGK